MLVKLLFLATLAAAFVTVAIYNDYRAALDAPLAIGDKPIIYTVEPGASFRSVVSDLRERGWWTHPSRYFLWHVRQRGIGGKLKSGEYELSPGMTALQLTALLVSGKTVQHQVTLVEGWTFTQIRAAIENSDVLQQTLNGLDDAMVMARLGHPGQHPEGRFFPDTYNITRNTTDLDLLKRAYVRMDEVLRQAWERRADDLPYQTPDEALIMASIVEKETGLAAERPQIASVFVQRLKRGMKLQTDPTVIYGIGSRYDGNIRRKDLETDTPYNTYMREGLPPTPIAMPGKDAIESALNPADTEALYFVARGDGSHVFSRTLEEHIQAVAEHQLKPAARQSPEKKELQ
jgi:UPF0755 protein